MKISYKSFTESYYPQFWNLLLDKISTGANEVFEAMYG